MRATEILAQARELPLEERRDIAEALLNDLEQEESPEFIAELERRAAEARAHPERCRPMEDVFADIEKRYRARQ